MMDYLFAAAYWAAIFVLLQLLVVKICSRNIPLKPWENSLRVMAMVWCVFALFKKAYLDELLPPIDALYHETIAREVANLLREFRFSEAMSYFGIGNQAYRFLLGVLYAVTSAPKVVTYTVNGALAFWAMLSLLEVMCIHSGCRRLPMVTVYSCMMLPSSLLWTTANLKEGPVLWGICMMLYLTCQTLLPANQSKRGMPLLGMLVLGLLRPHIAMLWFVTLSIVSMLRSKQKGLVILTGAGALAGMLLLRTAAPLLFEASMSDGIAASMSVRYETMTDNDNLVSHSFVNAKPTPVLTGLQLIMFRPWPTEVKGVGELLAGTEMWLLSSIGLGAWCRLSNRIRQFNNPTVLAMAFGLLLFGFFFSYMYNMGLVVRQRLMAYPALLFIYFWPTLCTKTGLVQPKHMPAGRFQRRRSSVASQISQA